MTLTVRSIEIKLSSGINSKGEAFSASEKAALMVVLSRRRQGEKNDDTYKKGNRDSAVQGGGESRQPRECF